MIEYHCPECNKSEISLEVIPKKQCDKCKKIMEAVEWEGDAPSFD